MNVADLEAVFMPWVGWLVAVFMPWVWWIIAPCLLDVN